MRKKQINIILSILVLIIYGAIFFKHFGKKNTHLSSLPYEQSLNILTSNLDIKRNDFDTSNIKKDPFGITKMTVSNILVNSESTKSSKKNLDKKINLISWPKIKYFGFVKNSINTTPLVLLRVNNKLHRRREKERIENIQIEKVYNDSIVLSYNNEKTTIIKINE